MDKPFASAHERPAAALRAGRVHAAVLLLTAPFLLASGWFPRPVVMLALAALAIPFALRLTTEGRLSRPTPLNLPLAILAIVCAPLSLAAGPALRAIAWPHVATLLWSLALFFAVVNWPRERSERWRQRGVAWGSPTRLYLALGAVTAVVGLLGMRSVDKLFYLPQTGQLAGRLGWGDGLPTNEIAGALTLFVPFAATLTLGCLLRGRRRTLLALAALTSLLLVTLVLTQSRTALIASGLGTLVAYVLTLRPDRKWIVVGLLALLVAALLVGLSPLRDWFIFAGANSWQSVIGPRLAIWSQAIDGVRDHPLWGMGFGAFGALSRLVYPLIPPVDAAPIEDAHNLYLQTALDFGLVGGALLIALLAIAFVAAARLVRARPARTLSRAWAAGLIGALAAHALYSLTDAVALGTLAGVPFWFLLGLIMRPDRPKVSEAAPARWPMVAGVGGVALLYALAAWLALPVNSAGELAANALLDPRSESVEAGRAALALADGNCRAEYYKGLAHHAAGDQTERAAAWARLFGCSADYIAYVAVLAPDDADLARQAIAAQPGSADGYFWLASLVAQANAHPSAPDEAIALYRLGLNFAPSDGRRWLALAQLLRGRDDTAALEAFLQACRHGDPGANGCLGAGQLAEARGDPSAAIGYYRLSNWPGALDRADALERQLAGEE
ncbi:O-antigen ligase family protein [Promineifilum sp.]|uniref:O-antigen ligase family protein n=1 Tax=Promineifilum sp. TaxID=2664178 RepID=UPI0035B32E5C